MPNTPPSINLIKNQSVPVFDKFMDWALTVGRLIVIFTEILAMLAFIYRISLDERLADLHSAIKQKQALVAVQKQDENKYRNLQDRITVAAMFSDKNTRSNKIFQDILGLIPQEITINDLSLSQEKLGINMTTASVLGLANFINPLKNYSAIKSISIDNIENKPSAGLSVNITAQFK